MVDILIPSFNQVMTLTRTISGETAFDESECRAYYDLAAALDPGSTIVEIGLQFGRSSSIVAQLITPLNLNYVGVDPFVEPPEAEDAWVAMMKGCKCDFSLLPVASCYAAGFSPNFPTSIHIALIDGDHSFDGVTTDCGIILPRITPGGHVCFHDYRRDSLPEVTAAVDAAMAGQPFAHVGTFGTLGVWKHI